MTPFSSLKDVLQKRKRAAYAALFALLATAAATGSWLGWQHWSEARSPHVLLTAFHTLYGDFAGGVFRFSVKDFDRNLVLDHETMEKYRFSDIPHDFFAQSVNPVEGGFLLTGGKPGRLEKEGKVFAIGHDGKAKLFLTTDDFRFRNIATGTVGGDPVFAGITHGEGYVHFLDLKTKAQRIFHVPYVPKVNVWGANYSTLMHFVDFIDLDRDGDDELYFTSTSPYAGVQGATSQYAEGTVFAMTFAKDGGKPKIENVGIPLPAFPRRLLAVRAPFQESVLVLYDGMLNGEGKTVLPVRLFKYVRDAKGEIVKKQVAELPGHSECKTITTLNFLDQPTVQIGCDNSQLYFFRDDGEKFTLVKTLKFSQQFIDQAYEKRRSGLQPWSIYSIHTVFGQDVDGDGKDEMVVGINNDGFYLVDSENPEDRSKHISFGFVGGERVLDRDEAFVFTDGNFEPVGEPSPGNPYFTP